MKRLSNVSLELAPSDCYILVYLVVMPIKIFQKEVIQSLILVTILIKALTVIFLSLSNILRFKHRSTCIAVSSLDCVRHALNRMLTYDVCCGSVAVKCMESIEHITKLRCMFRSIQTIFRNQLLWKHFIQTCFSVLGNILIWLDFLRDVQFFAVIIVALNELMDLLVTN